jgi:hypothetical protein
MIDNRKPTTGESYVLIEEATSLIRPSMNESVSHPQQGAPG